MIRRCLRRHWHWLGLLLMAAAGRSVLFGAGEPAPANGAAIEKQARAILQTNCYRCHSHQAGKSKGGLMVDSLASMRKGGTTGPAVMPGQPDKSLLYKAILHEDPELKMPRGGKLSDADIAVLRSWIKAGAPWTEAPVKTGVRVPGQITEEDRRYWAFQPVKAVPPPEVRDPAWSQNPIDRFIRQRLDA